MITTLFHINLPFQVLLPLIYVNLVYLPQIQPLSLISNLNISYVPVYSCYGSYEPSNPEKTICPDTGGFYDDIPYTVSRFRRVSSTWELQGISCLNYKINKGFFSLDSKFVRTDPSCSIVSDECRIVSIRGNSDVFHFGGSECFLSLWQCDNNLGTLCWTEDLYSSLHEYKEIKYILIQITTGYLVLTDYKEVMYARHLGKRGLYRTEAAWTFFHNGPIFKLHDLSIDLLIHFPEDNHYVTLAERELIHRTHMCFHSRTYQNYNGEVPKSIFWDRKHKWKVNEGVYYKKICKIEYHNILWINDKPSTTDSRCVSNLNWDLSEDCVPTSFIILADGSVLYSNGTRTGTYTEYKIMVPVITTALGTFSFTLLCKKIWDHRNIIISSLFGVHRFMALFIRFK